MPDWSYRTVLRPVLFALPPCPASRDLALSVMGALGSAWPGRLLIDLLGHMRPPEGIGVTLAGLTFPSRMGPGLRPPFRAARHQRAGALRLRVRRGRPHRPRAAARWRHRADDPSRRACAPPRTGPLHAAADAAARLAGIDRAGAVILARLEAVGHAGGEAR